MSGKIIPSGVLLSGYYGFGNAGDEAILLGAVEAFRSKGVEVAVLSHTPAVTHEQLQVNCFGRKKISDILKGVWRSRVILSGGGGLYQDKTSLKSLVYYLRIPVLGKLLGKKTMVFAQGIGPINTANGKRLTRWVCNRFIDRITVRDEESKALLESLGVRKKIEVTADLAFLLQPPSETEIKAVGDKLLPAGKERKPLLGVVLRHWEGMDALAPEIAGGVSRFSEASGVTPVLVPFQPGEDDALTDALHHEMKAPHILIRERLSPRELLSLTGSFKLVLGMRYHSLVFAAKNQVPFVGIGYDPKVEHVACHFRAPLLSLKGLSAAALEAALVNSWQNLDHLRKTLKEELPALGNKAEYNVTLALELLQGRA